MSESRKKKTIDQISTHFTDALFKLSRKKDISSRVKIRDVLHVWKDIKELVNTTILDSRKELSWMENSFKEIEKKNLQLTDRLEDMNSKYTELETNYNEKMQENKQIIEKLQKDGKTNHQYLPINMRSKPTIDSEFNQKNDELSSKTEMQLVLLQTQIGKKEKELEEIQYKLKQEIKKVQELNQTILNERNIKEKLKEKIRSYEPTDETLKNTSELILLNQEISELLKFLKGSYNENSKKIEQFNEENDRLKNELNMMKKNENELIQLRLKINNLEEQMKFKDDIINESEIKRKDIDNAYLTLCNINRDVENLKNTLELDNEKLKKQLDNFFAEYADMEKSKNDKIEAKSNEIDDLRDELERRRNDIKEFIDSNDLKIQQILELRDKNEQLENEYENIIKENRKLHIKVNENLMYIEKSDISNKNLSDELNELKMKFETVKNRIESLEVNNLNLKTEISRKKSENDVLVSDNYILKNQLSKLELLLGEKICEIEKSDEKIKNMSDDINSLTRNRNDLFKQLSESQKSYTDIVKEHLQMVDTNAKLTKENEKCENTISEFTRGIKVERSIVKELKDQLKKYEQEITCSTTSFNKIKMDMNSHLEENSNLKEQISDLKHEKKILEMEILELKRRLEGGQVSSTITVSPRKQNAVTNSDSNLSIQKTHSRNNDILDKNQSEKKWIKIGDSIQLKVRKNYYHFIYTSLGRSRYHTCIYTNVQDDPLNFHLVEDFFESKKKKEIENTIFRNVFPNRPEIIIIIFDYSQEVNLYDFGKKRIVNDYKHAIVMDKTLLSGKTNKNNYVSIKSNLEKSYMEAIDTKSIIPAIQVIHEDLQSWIGGLAEEIPKSINDFLDNLIAM